MKDKMKEKNPHIIDINKGQAHVIKNESLESILTSSDSERREYAYKEN